jgi:hypothetical protein
MKSKAMKNITSHETFSRVELEACLQNPEAEELEVRFEMITSWCTSGCGTSKPAEAK